MKYFNIKNNCLIVNKLLESEGFELEDHSPAGYDCDYEKVIPHDDIYTLWINVSLRDRKVYFYDFFDYRHCTYCGWFNFLHVHCTSR